MPPLDPVRGTRRSTALARVGFCLIVMLLVCSASPAMAHGYILRAIPEDRAVLERPPTRVQYWFSERLERQFSSIQVRDRTGEVIATGSVPEDDDSLLAARLPAGIPDGVYIVELRPAFASDGHVVAESRVFFIGHEIKGVAGASVSSAAVPLEIIWRAVVLSSTILLFGTFTLYSNVLVPAWGSAEYRAGLLPPRVMRRLNRIVSAALVVALVGNIGALIQQAMVFYDVDAAQVLNRGLWDGVRAGSRFGEVWNARMALLALVGVFHTASIYFRDDQPELVRPFWTANVWLMALALGTSSIASHAAGSLLWPWVALTVDWLHILGVAFWAGGIGALALALPVALKPYQGAARRMALLAVMRRFSRLVVAAVLIVLSTGIYSAANWLYTPSDLTQTSYGGALILKGLLVAALLLVGALHHISLRPHLAVQMERTTTFLGPVQRWAIRLFYRLIGSAVQFAATLRIEAAFALAVVTAAGVLSATPIPAPAALQKSAQPLSDTQTADDLTATMTISPGGPGVNSYDVQVSRAGKPFDGLDIQFQMVNPARDWRSPAETAQNVDSGLYVGEGDELDRAGTWWSLLDITRPDDRQTRIAYQWTIRDEAALVQSRDPGAIHILALIGVLAAVGYAIFPAAQRFYRTLDLRPQTVAVALGATAITALLVGFGSAAVQQAEQQYEKTLNPPPSVVNGVLPDAQSLGRGKALYEAHCRDWGANAPDLAALRASLTYLRDDALYTATLDGWRTLPPCTGDLDEMQRWDIVNYLRTLKHE